jgi:hypothetical protein
MFDPRWRSAPCREARERNFKVVAPPICIKFPSLSLLDYVFFSEPTIKGKGDSGGGLDEEVDLMPQHDSISFVAFCIYNT